MKKKILSRLLLTSAIVLPLSVVALSWSTDQKVKEEKAAQELKYVGNKVALNTDKMIEAKGFKAAETVEHIDEAVKKVKFDYPNKQNVLAKDAEKGDVVSSGYDLKKYELVIKYFEFEENSNTVFITFMLKNKQTNETSIEITDFIFDFKEENVVDVDLNNIAKTVLLDYPNKQNTLQIDAVANDVVASGFDTAKYDVLVKSLVAGENNSMLATYYVIDKTTNKTSIDFEKLIDGFKVEIVVNEDIDEDASKVVLDYPNKSNIFSSKANYREIKFSGYDVNKYDVTFNEIKGNDAEGFLSVVFTLNNKTTGAISKLTTKIITGFKKQVVVVEDINEVAKKVTLEYPNKLKVLPSEADRNLIQSSGFESTKYQLTIVTINTNDEAGYLSVNFRLTDRMSGKISEQVTKMIIGFKKKMVVVEDIESIAKNVTFDYPNKQNIVASAAVKESVESAGYNKSTHVVSILSFITDETKRLVTFTYYVINKATKKTSTVFTKQLIGFAFPKASKETLNAEANKVKADYPEKATIFANEANNARFIFSGFDQTKFKVYVTRISSNKEAGTSIVSFKLYDIKDNKNQSDEKQVTVSGFKTQVQFTKEELAELAKKINFDYKNKSNVYPWETNTYGFTAYNVTTGTTVSNIRVTGLNSKNLNAIITFTLTSNHNSSIKVEHSKEISGFKTLSQNHSNLTKILFGDKTKTYFNLYNQPIQTLNLYRELAKPNAEITFDYSARKILMSSNGKVVNIAKPETYVEVGTLTEAYRRVHSKVTSEVKEEIEKIMKRDNTIYLFVFKLFGWSNDYAKKQYERYKHSMAKVAGKIDRNVEFFRTYIRDIEEFMKRDNYTIIYNPKTGIFSTPSGTGEIDLANPKSYKDFIRLRTHVKDAINSEIKEELRELRIDSSISDLFLNDRNSDSVFIFQKKNGKPLTTGLKIRQTSGRRN